MIVTAPQRLPPSRACRPTMIGHVATTIIVAQTVAPTNGNNTHRLAVIIKPMNTTPSVMRVMSRDAGLSVFIYSPDATHWISKFNRLWRRTASVLPETTDAALGGVSLVHRVFYFVITIAIYPNTVSNTPETA